MKARGGVLERHHSEPIGPSKHPQGRPRKLPQRRLGIVVGIPLLQHGHPRHVTKGVQGLSGPGGINDLDRQASRLRERGPVIQFSRSQQHRPGIRADADRMNRLNLAMVGGFRLRPEPPVEIDSFRVEVVGTGVVAEVIDASIDRTPNVLRREIAPGTRSDQDTILIVGLMGYPR